MDSSHNIIRTLNWFYSLELNQVDLYTAQSKHFEDQYIARTLARVAVIEQQHVDNIADLIKNFGKTPTRIGDTIAPITGKVAGKAVSAAGLAATLRINIKLEQKAMEDYANFISRVNDQDLIDLLWSNYIDEDLHTSWFAAKLKEIELVESTK